MQYKQAPQPSVRWLHNMQSPSSKSYLPYSDPDHIILVLLDSHLRSKHALSLASSGADGDGDGPAGSIGPRLHWRAGTLGRGGRAGGCRLGPKAAGERSKGNKGRHKAHGQNGNGGVLDDLCPSGQRLRRHPDVLSADGPLQPPLVACRGCARSREMQCMLPDLGSHKFVSACMQKGVRMREGFPSTPRRQGWRNTAEQAPQHSCSCCPRTSPCCWGRPSPGLQCATKEQPEIAISSHGRHW